MSDRSLHGSPRWREEPITGRTRAAAWIVAAVASTVALAQRRPLTSATVTPIATVRRIRHLPFKSLWGSLRWLRRLCFTRPRSSEPSVVVPESREAVLGLLGRNNFVPGWTVSYNYRDELLNLRRIECSPHPSGLDWWQVHVRGYDHADGIELTAHFEPEPRRHPRAHLRLTGIDVDHGMDTLLELLDRHEIDYDRLDRSLEL